MHWCQPRCAGTTNVVIGGTPVVIVPTPATADCEASNNGTNKGYSVMANGYVDLGTYVGITPYVGGGIGIAYSKYFKTHGERDCVEVAPDPVSGAGGIPAATIRLDTRVRKIPKPSTTSPTRSAPACPTR